MKTLEDLLCQQHEGISFRPLPGQVKVKPYTWTAKWSVLTNKPCQYRDIFRSEWAIECQRSLAVAFGREVDRQLVKAIMRGKQ